MESVQLGVHGVLHSYLDWVLVFCVRSLKLVIVGRRVFDKAITAVVITSYSRKV